MELVGRSEALRAVDEALAAAVQGRLGAVLVEGRAGMGRSALLAAAHERAAVAGLRVLIARAHASDRGDALGVARQLLRRPLEACAEREPACARALERLLGAGAADLPTADAGDATRWALEAAVLVLTGDGPLALLVDDVHEADEASGRLLAAVVRRFAAEPVLVVATRRLPAVPEDGQAAAELMAEPRCARVRLRALEPADVEALAGGPEAAAALVELTAGVPALAGELLRDAADAGARDLAAWLREAGPAALAAPLERRLRDLDPAAPETAHAVVALGAAATRDRVVRVAGDGAARALARLREAGHVTTREPLGLVHPRLADAVARVADPAAAAALHGRIATVLEDEGAPAGVVAVHLARTEPAGRERTVWTLRAAAAGAREAGDHAAAAELLRRALREPPSAGERSAVLRELAGSEMRADLDAGLERGRQSIEAATDADDRVAAVTALAQALVEHGRAREGMAELDGLAAALEAAGDEARLAAVRGQALALAQVDPDGRRHEREQLAGLVGAARAAPGHLPAAALPPAAYELACAGGTAPEVVDLIGRAWGDGELATTYPGWMQACLMLGMVVACDGHALLDRIVPALLRHPLTRASAHATAMLLAVRASSRWMCGDLTGAEADAQAGIRLTAHEDMWRASMARNLVELALVRGDVAGAERALEAAAPPAGPVKRLLTALLVEGRVKLRVALDDPQGALADCEACAGFEAEWEMTNPFPLLWRAHAVPALLALDRRREALASGEEALAAAKRFGSPRLVAEALRHVALASEDHDERRRHLEAAVAAVRDDRAQTQHLLALLELGDLEVGAGDADAGRAHLYEALHRAHELGAVPLRDRAHAALLAAGARPRRMATRGRDSLSPAEQAVAEVVARGASNREAAEALFLSVKTVETHLRQCYRKLGISRRDQLAAALSDG